jgi:beta-glucanase (GH16 family)
MRGVIGHLAPLALVCLVTGCAAQDTRLPAREGWVLAWNDEFDGPAIDTDKWRVEYAAVVKNEELQFYIDDEVYIEDGCLVLRSREREFGGREYTSGLVDTQHRFAQVFGRFEVRAQLPTGQGVWPAHWMLPEDHPAWPPEIDIMEALGHEPNVVHLTHHWGTWPNNASRGVAHQGPDFSDGFHTFAIEWSPKRIDWFIDDALAFTSTADIPQIPFYVILNTAIGGHWPGHPDETPTFPQHHRIDYVRVYTRDNQTRPILRVKSPHGRVVLDPPRYVFNPGETVTARAEPDFGYQFTGWDGSPSEAGEITFTMDRPRTLTARFEPDPDLPTLLTRGASATATSSESASLGPENAIDGRPGTRWGSAFSDPQDLTIDLGILTQIELVRIVWENAFPSEYELLASADGTGWQVIHAARKSDASPDILPGSKQPARYLRVHAKSRATKWGVSIWEFEAYGLAVDQD